MDIITMAERVFKNSMMDGNDKGKKFFLALSTSKDENTVDEPKDIFYKRVEINFKDFAVMEKYDWKSFSKKIIYSNMFSVIFPESSCSWGKIRRVFVLDEEGTIWFYKKLKRQKIVPAHVIVLFDPGEIDITFE